MYEDIVQMALNLLTIQDYEVYKSLRRLGLYNSALELKNPNKIGSIMGMPKQLISMVGNFLEHAPKTLRG